MNLNRTFFIFLSFLLILELHGQTYNVGNYRKINAINNGFTGNLDDSDFFGVSSDGIGDLDGDGVADMVVGAFGDDDGGLDKGAVWVLFMNADGTVKTHRKISDVTGGLSVALDVSDVFGGGVAFLGDLDGDGYIEIAVAADYDGDGGYWNGAFYILSLNVDGSVRSRQKISAFEGGFTGLLSGDNIFGTDVENIGDLDGDGVQDLAVGARRYDLGDADAGAVFILYMNPDLTVKSHVLIGEGVGGFTADLSGSDYFGGAIANIGDLDNDGVTDIAVGAYRDNDGSLNSGCIYILFLNPDGTVKAHQKISNTSGNFPFAIPSNALFGESLDGILDLDADGKPEILVGSMRDINETLNVNTGAFYIIELEATGRVSEAFKYTYGSYCFQGDLRGGDLFGGSVAVVDAGKGRLVVGAYGDSQNGSRQGAAWVLDLGEMPSVVAVKDPGRCSGLGDGELLIDGLVPDADYTFSYVFEGVNESGVLRTNVDGTMLVSGLEGGVYEDLKVALGGVCEKFLGDQTLARAHLDLSLGLSKESGCGMRDGEMVVSGFVPGESVQFVYEFMGAPVSRNTVVNPQGIAELSGLSSGVYVSLEARTNDGCIYGFDDVVVESGDVYFVFDILQPDFCSGTTGALQFNVSLLPGVYDYVYIHKGGNHMGQFMVDDNGDGLIEGLPAGFIEGMVLNPEGFGCEFEVEDFDVLPGLSGANHQFFMPSDCDSSDGQLVLEGVSPGVTVEYSYSFNGIRESGQVVSTVNGGVFLKRLSAGYYEDIRLFLNGCEWSLPFYELSCRLDLSCVVTPRFFSPNGDGINDYWEVSATSQSCFLWVYIYDRYGKLLYQYKNGEGGWDGKYQGKPMPNNDYWYSVFLSDGKSVKGHFSLRR